MLIIEIVVLFFLSRNLSRIAINKGESPVKWAIICILAWMAGESMALIVLVSVLGEVPVTDYTNALLISLFGAGTGYLFYLFAKQALLKLPDLEED